LRLKTKLFGQVYEFKDVKDVLAKANELKSGDQLAGIAAETVQERIAAKEVLSNLTIKDIYENPVAPYEEDEVTRVIQDGINFKAYERVKNWTIAHLREFILDDHVSTADIRAISNGLSSEVVSAVTKLMSSLDLMIGGQKLPVFKTCVTTCGYPDRLSFRLQPNHPTDDVDGMAISYMEGFSYCCGDALFGMNPVDDTIGAVDRTLRSYYDFVQKWEIPTQTCCLAHVTTQMECVKNGAPEDLMFQSLAGSQIANDAFGISVAMLDEAIDLMLHQGTSQGPDPMYFETGEGSELSADGAWGADQLTMESRCYGLAKRYHPFVVDSVVGFIGPEYLYDGKQVARAGMEDHFMGKLQGISMGCDACYTNHMKCDQNDNENLETLLAAAGCCFFMGVPCADDCMLMYQSTGYHDDHATRQATHKRPLPEFEKWCQKMGFLEDDGLTLGPNAGDASVFL